MRHTQARSWSWGGKGHQGEREGSKHGAGRPAALDDRACKSPPTLVGVLDRHEAGTRPLTTDCDALQQPKRNEKDRRGRAYPTGTGRTITQTTTGPISMRLASSDHEIDVHAEFAFIGVGAVSATSGFTTSNLGDAAMMAAMIARSARVAILADSTKFGNDLFAEVAPLEAADYLITNAEPPAPLAAALKAAGVEVLIGE